PLDPKSGRFPCCIVWAPLPVVSWLAPFIGHLGLCRRDGTVFDFSGSNLVNADDFAFGPVARYLPLSPSRCCFPPGGHSCDHHRRRRARSEFGTAASWDEALDLTRRRFEGKSYNLFTCNCHSFVANFMNRVCYAGSADWNVISVAALVLLGGRWVDAPSSAARSFAPFAAAVCLGVYVAGWPFLVGLLSFSFLLLGWFVLATYVFRSLLEC
ncbi:hypothetical protein M569_16644, partial [Genlisea aurea]